MEVDANRVIEKLIQEIGQLRLQIAIMQAQIEQAAEQQQPEQQEQSE